jgi:hypothetical protein
MLANVTVRTDKQREANFQSKKGETRVLREKRGSSSKKITVTRIPSKLTLLELLRRVATRAATARRETKILVEVDAFIISAVLYCVVFDLFLKLCAKSKREKTRQRFFEFRVVREPIWTFFFTLIAVHARLQGCV